jgi:ankyrin repeat protein
MILPLILAILSFNFSSIQSSNNFRINFQKKSMEDLHDEETKSNYISNFNLFTTNTLMIDANFQRHWIILMSTIDSLLLKPQQSRFKYFPFPFMDPQARLISGISNNDPRAVKRAIDEGANFLEVGSKSKIKSICQNPIEYAVTAGKVRALRTMLDQIIFIPLNLMYDFLGGLLIKAVQAGQLNSIKLLINSYNAPYLSDSFLLQKAIMHQASIDIIEYIMEKFISEPELFQSFGKHNDSLLHLTIRFNNFDAFIYFYHRRDVKKNVMNRNSLEPIDLLASLPFKSLFFQNLIRSHPYILTSWIDDYKNNLLHLACYYNDIIFVRRLIEETNFPIDRKTVDNSTPLLISYFADKREISLYLIKNGADPFHKDNYNLNVLMYAVRNRDFNFFTSCLEAINPNEVEESLKDLVENLIEEDRTDALNILSEFFPFLNKETY